MRRSLLAQWFAVGLAIGLAAGVILATSLTATTAGKSRPAPAATAPHLTIYIRDLAQRYISTREIRNDIPAWTRAVNGQFAQAWHTEQVRFRLLGVRQPPAGATVAVFKQKGPVQGALAFHYTPRGAPAITVYAGTGHYYGYSNSVSFTHEAFELLADPTISQTNQGYPYPYYTAGSQQQTQLPGTVWFNEVCDPVEDYTYQLPGADGKPVAISDWVTPNWFNDHVQGGYDEMGVIQAPFTVARGGYAQYWNSLGWTVVSDFRGAGRDANGYLKAERNLKEGS